MDPNEELKYFKTRKAMAQAAMCSRQAVSVWFRTGLIPLRSAELLRRARKPKQGRKR